MYHMLSCDWYAVRCVVVMYVCTLELIVCYEVHTNSVTAV